MAAGNALLDMYEEFNHIGKYAQKENDDNIILEKVVKQEEVKKPEIIYNSSALCPQCGTKLEHEGGCDICRDCGWTKCD